MTAPISLHDCHARSETLSTPQAAASPIRRTPNAIDAPRTIASPRSDAAPRASKPPSTEAGGGPGDAPSAVALVTQVAPELRLRKGSRIHVACRLGLFGGAALAVTTLACSSAGSGGASPDTRAGGECHWPDSLNDAGPGSCDVGRAYLKCTYESGVAGDDTSGSGPLFVSCLSNDV